jgi:DNA-binding protein
VGYVRTQFIEEKRKYVFVKARGQAVENALKVVQLVKENLGGIHSCTKFSLQYGGKADVIDQNEREITSFDLFKEIKYVQEKKIHPAVEVILSVDELNPLDPGY